VYTVGQQTVKDFRSYLSNWKTVEADGTTSSGKYWYSLVTSQVNADGSFSQAAVDNDGGERTYSDYAADGALKGSAGRCQYVYTPAMVTVPGSLTIGQEWSGKSVRTCSDDTSENTTVTVKGAVAGLESVTVAAGTFSTIKLSYTRTFAFKTSTAVIESTCWRDTVTGINVKCENASTTTPNAGGAGYKDTSSIELGGYLQASSGLRKDNIERFAGKWQTWYSGQENGICDVQIADAGTISGTCYDNSGYQFGINGTVDARGVATFNLQTGGFAGPVFSGSFESPLKIAGTWSMGSENGTWYMLHL